MTELAFTIGRTAAYDHALADTEHPLYKSGQHDDYEGGWVWSSPQEAANFLDSSQLVTTYPNRSSNEFIIYVLELPTDWKTDVSVERADDGSHHLLHDALVLYKYKELYDE